MRQLQIRDIWQAGGAVVNGWLTIPDSFSAETMAHQGWDTLTIDMQHGVIGYQQAVHMLTAIATTDTIPLVRVPWLEPGMIMKMLDAGACGIICPMINSRAEAEQLVSVTRYPPLGSRSFGPVRALLAAGADYPYHANQQVINFAMIETRAALDHLDEILSVDGLDAVYIGPADLSLALGCSPQFDQEEAPVVAAIDFILERARAHGVVAAIHNGSAEYAKRMIDKGFQLVTISSDARLMAAGAQQALATVRDSGALCTLTPTLSRQAGEGD
jgi:4-hydroxy-2-oxoheptanedioate aldolase